MVRLSVSDSFYKKLPLDRKEACDILYEKVGCLECPFREHLIVQEDEEGRYIDEWDECLIDEDECWYDEIREQGEKFWEKK